MELTMNDDIWSRQFYKALEAVGKLTEVEKIRLANILIAVSDIEEKHSSVKPTPLKREIPPYDPRPLRTVSGSYQPVKSETSGEIKSPPKKP